MYTGVRKNETLPNFVGQNINYLESWISSRNITLNKNYTESNSCNEGSILEQNVHSGVIVSSISSLSVNVCKNVHVNEPITPQEPENNNEENNDQIDDPIEDMLN